MDLREFTDWLFKLDNPAEPLILAIQYIKMYASVGAVKFRLPKDHAHLSIIISTFATDLPSLVSYVKHVRDELDDKRSVGVHEVYITLLIRLTQQIRRSRLNLAYEVYEKAKGNLTYDDRLLYGKRLEQVWGSKRMAAMKSYRYGKSRQTADERTEILEEFWDEVDRGIRKGEYIDI